MSGMHRSRIMQTHVNMLRISVQVLGCKLQCAMSLKQTIYQDDQNLSWIENKNTLNRDESLSENQHHKYCIATTWDQSVDIINIALQLCGISVDKQDSITSFLVWDFKLSRNKLIRLIEFHGWDPDPAL